MRTFAEQVKHVACANFAFVAEFDGQQPPAMCDKGGPDPAKTKRELLIYLRNSFVAISKSFQRIKTENQFDPVEGPHAGPNTRLGLAGVVIWHNAEHYGQMVVYLRLNGIVPPPKPSQSSPGKRYALRVWNSAGQNELSPRIAWVPRVPSFRPQRS